VLYLVSKNGTNNKQIYLNYVSPLHSCLAETCFSNCAVSRVCFSICVQVSLWDGIIQAKEGAKFSIQTKNKYRFIDQVNPSDQDAPHNYTNVCVCVCRTSACTHTYTYRMMKLRIFPSHTNYNKLSNRPSPLPFRL
jgi:hypothetical protein